MRRSIHRRAALLATALVAAVLGAASPTGSAAQGVGEACATAEPPTYVSQARSSGDLDIPELDGATSGEYPDAGMEISVAAADAPAGSVTGAPWATDFSAQIFTLTVTWQGRTQTLTTAPKHPGAHYPSRGGPSAADTAAGPVTVDTIDGQTYVVLHRNSSGIATRLAWRIDDPCPAPDAAPTDAIVGAPTYTG